MKKWNNILLRSAFLVALTQEEATPICKLALTVIFLNLCFTFQTLDLARRNYQVWLVIFFLIGQTNNFAPGCLASLFLVGNCLTKPWVWNMKQQVKLLTAVNPFTPESDQCQISPPAAPEILHNTVRRTWLFIALLRLKTIIIQILVTSLMHFLFKRLGECTSWAQEWKGKLATGSKGTFFWDYSTYSNSGIDGTCILLGAIPIPEWTECYSIHSAPNSRMDGIVFWWENCTFALVSFDHISYSVFGIARDLFYWELIFCVFCYSYSEIGINGIVPKERSLNVIFTSQQS